MENQKNFAVFVLAVVIISGIVIVALALTTRAPSAVAQEQKTKVEAPITDFSTSEVSNEKGRKEKQAKEKKYKRYVDVIGEGIVNYSQFEHLPPGFPALPVAQSDVVVVGEISEAKATLTSDKTSVYSEFVARIEEVMKNDSETPLFADDSIVVERPGGRVKLPSGKVSKFSIVGWGMPQKGGRYVLFLKRNIEDQTYRILTGYELRGGRVFPLDESTSSDTSYAAFANADEMDFINKVRAANATL